MLSPKTFAVTLVVALSATAAYAAPAMMARRLRPKSRPKACSM